MKTRLPATSVAALLSSVASVACGHDRPSGSGDVAAASVASAGIATPRAADSAPSDGLRRHGAPRVSLSGDSPAESVSTPVLSTKRVYARSARTWVVARPAAGAEKLGYLRLGSSLPTTELPAAREGCPGGWYAVPPQGFVCVGKEASLDSSDGAVSATAAFPPRTGQKLPYIYGTVRRPGPVYGHLPSDDELRRAEPDIDERMKTWLSAAGEVGAGYAQFVWLGAPGQPPDPAAAWQSRQTDTLPQFLADAKPLPTLGGTPQDGDGAVVARMKPRLGYSLLTTLLWHGRRYGLTTDLLLVPTDRLRPIQGSEFHGFEIGRDVKFPFAIVRREDAKFWLYQQTGDRLVDAGNAAYRSAVQLTGKQNFFKGRLHYETSDGKWLSDRDASRLDPIRRMPKWGKDGERWIDVNISKQTLLLLEGETAVYATLISSGEAGLEDPGHTTATKRGIFRIHTKHLTATMDSDEVGEEFELRDVPYVQYFDKQGYALHGAYWHDRFGVPKSHGCINLAPEDARRIFFWTEPQLPEGWHGATLPRTGTVMFVHP